MCFVEILDVAIVSRVFGDPPTKPKGF